MNFIHQLHLWDREATLGINALHSPVTDRIWILFSHRWIWCIMYAVVVFFLFRRLGWRRALIWVAAMALMVLCCDHFSTFIKELVARWRPCKDPYMIHHGLWVLEGGEKYGFFSAHAANAIAFAIMSVMAFRSDGSRCIPYTLWIFCWAFLVGFSRIFVGKHFLGDVLVGFLAGALVAFLIGGLARWLTARSTASRPLSR